MKKKLVYQILSIFLCVLMVTQCLPMRAIAQGVQSLAAMSESESETPDSEKIPALEESREEEPYILYELVEKREEDTKHFLMSDRSVMAAKYEVPVHYKKNGEWVDINLTAVSSSSEISMPENDFETKFSKKSNGKKLVTVTKEGYKLSWGLDGAEKVNAEYSSFDSSASEDISVLKNLEGVVTYPEIFSDVDLEYVVSGEGIKENIILKNENAPTEFRFHYETGHLSLRLNDEGNLELIDGEKVVFTIEKPVMFDSAKAFSEKVKMILEETGNGKFTLTLIPDEEWLSSEDRAWPVVIDPTVFSSTIDKTIWDINLSKSNPSIAQSHLADDNAVGSNGTYDVWRSLICFKEMPEFGSSTILSAKLQLTSYLGPLYEGNSPLRPKPAGSIQVNAHRITEYWPEKTATWNSHADKFDPIVEDFFTYSSAEEVFVLDITELVTGWYNNTYENYGVMLKSANETATGQIMQFTSSDWGNNDDEIRKTWRPRLLIAYRNTIGLEDYWSYTTQSSIDGTGYINNFNGNLTWVLPDATYNSGVNGFTVAHVYNSANATETTPYGRGWNINLHQRIGGAAYDLGIETASYYHVDGDGTMHFFIQQDGKYVDEDGLGYEYVYAGETDLPHYLIDKDKTKYYFDASCLLRQITDANGNSIYITHTSLSTGKAISSVTTSTGGSIQFAYDSSGYLSSVTDTAERITYFNINGGALSKITKPSSGEVNLQYTNGLITQVKSQDDSSFVYSYDSHGKVSSFSEESKNGSLRNTKTFSYSYNQTAITEESGYQLTYQFDTWGRPTCIYDNHDQSYFQTYTNQSNTSGNLFANNKVTLTASSVQYIDNRLNNSTFSSGLNGWSILGNATVVEDQLYVTNRSAKMAGSAQDYYVIMQTPRYEAGKTYTFSAYLKWEGVIPAGGGGASIEIVTTINGQNRFYHAPFVTGSSDPAVENGFVRFEKTITLQPGENIARISAGLYAASGTVWVNGIQFEEGESANYVNLLSNSGFEANANGTATPAYFDNNAPYGSVSTAEKKGGSNSYRIQGQGSLNQYVAQPTGLSGKAGDVYTFGAWAKADALPSHETNGTTGLKMVMQIVPADGSGDLWANVLFNENVSDWQFGTQTVVIEKDYRDIYLFLCYYKNANTAYFDSAFLYRDTAQSYRYDGNGNVVSTTDYASQQNSYSYQNNNLSKLISPDGTGFEYFYDAKGNLISSHSAEGLVNQFTYDEKGNPVSSETFANESSATIVSGKTYYIQMKSTGQYLTLENASTTVGTNVVEVPFTGGGEQRWKFVSSPQGGYIIIPEIAPTMALDVLNAADAENTNIQIFTQNGTSAQRFFVNPQKNYTYQLTPASSTTGKVLTLNRPRTPDNVAILSPQGEMNPDQCWIIKEAVDNTPLEEGLYHIRFRHSGAYLDVPEYSSAVGTALWQFEYNDSKAQIFHIKPYGNTEYFTISPVYAENQYLRVSATSANADGYYRLELGDGTITDASLFKLSYNQVSRGYQLFPKTNEGLSLDVYGALADSRSDVVFCPHHYGTNQTFILEKVSSRITSSMTYQDNGNFPESVTDSRGNTTYYAYDFAKGLLDSTTDAKGNVTGYTYDPNTDLVTGVSSGSSTVRYLYQNGGYLQSITSPSGTQYNFLYDEFYQNTEIRVGEQNLSTNVYDEEGKITKTTYGNGEYIEFVYNDLDQIVEKKYNGVAKVRYRYDKAGKLYEATDLFENVTTRYRYDLTGRILEAKRSDGKILRYTYDNLNRVSKITTTLNSVSSSTEYLYGDTAAGQKAGLIYGVKENGTQTISYAYDELVRLNQRVLTSANNFTTQYEYLEGAGATDTTTLIKTVKNGNDTFLYEYDELGNILSVSKNGTEIESYTYDSLNQLASVTRGEDIWTYTYDNGGNILSVQKNGVAEKSYTYGNANWKDLLTAFNGQSIAYDAIGNPLQYRDGMAFTWANGRRLSSVSYNGKSISYAYNEAGLRISKTVNGVTTTYHWLEGVLLGQTCGNDTILFRYDENGSAYGFTLNGTAYYYVFNLQGDIIGILNSAGVQVVSYDYDAWGNVLSVTGDTTLGNLNPLRYRGYYYDVETGFYYLQSRYYDSVTCRFINADALLDQSAILGNNTFTYCLNNPVNGIDPCGSCFHHWQFWKACEKCKKKSKFPVEKLKNEDGSISVYDNQRIHPDSVFHEQFLAITPNTNASVNKKEMSAGGSFDLVTGGWETENMDLSLLDFGHAEANLKLDKDGTKIGALASIWSPSITFNFWLIEISYEVEVGAIGIGYERDISSIKFGGSLGLGSALKISWANEG